MADPTDPRTASPTAPGTPWELRPSCLLCSVCWAARGPLRPRSRPTGIGSWDLGATGAGSRPAPQVSLGDVSPEIIPSLRDPSRATAQAHSRSGVRHGMAWTVLLD